MGDTVETSMSGGQALYIGMTGVSGEGECVLTGRHSTDFNWDAMHILAYVGPFEGSAGMECGAVISLSEGARYNEVYKAELHDTGSLAATVVGNEGATKMIIQINVGSLQIDSIDTVMEYDLPYDISTYGFAFIGFSDVGSDYESDYEYELNFVLATSHDASVVVVFGVGENDECTISGEAIEDGYFQPFIIIGPDYYGDMDNLPFELQDNMDPEFLNTYSQGGMTCSFVLMPTMEAYYLTFGSGETTIVANGQEFDVLVVEYLEGDDEYWEEEWSEESVPELELWDDRSDMEDSDIFGYLTGAGLALNEQIFDMTGEYQYYRFEIIETYPGDLMYVQMNGVDPDSSCYIEYYGGDGAHIIQLFGLTGPAQVSGSEQYYCGALLFVDPAEAQDGHRIWGYLATDDWMSLLEAEIRIGTEFAPEESDTDAIAEASDFEDAYQAAMQVFYRLNHH